VVAQKYYFYCFYRNRGDDNF